MEIPITLERVLIRAASDASFRESLLDDPERAVDENDYCMVASERASLMAIPRSTLEIMIDRFRPLKHTRSRFARKVVSAVASSLIVTAASCGPADSSRDAAVEDTGPDDGYDFGIDALGGDVPDWPPDVVEEDGDPDVSDDVLDDGDSSDMMDVEDENADEDADEDSTDDTEESDG